MFGDMLFAGTVGDGHDIELDNGLCGLLRIGYSLTGDLSIYGTPGLPNEGITGQVIINALNWPDDEPNGWGQWTGAVNIGPQGAVETLDPKPYYNNKSSDIGGGAVGLVPYYLHYADCTPSGTKVNEASNGLDGLGECDEGYHASRKGAMGNAVEGPLLRHYGRIEQVGTGKPFTVRSKQLGGIGCNWLDITDVGIGFAHEMHPGGDTRAIKINGPFMPGYDYLIEPKRTGSNILICNNAELGLPMSEPVMEYDFRFRVFVLQDLTLNGLLQPDDIVAWILNPQDTTLDGTTDNNDLVDVINAVAEYGE